MLSRWARTRKMGFDQNATKVFWRESRPHGRASPKGKGQHGPQQSRRLNFRKTMAYIKSCSTKTKDGVKIELRSPSEADAQAFIDFCTQIYSTSPYLITKPDEFTPDLEKQKAWIQDLRSNTGAVCITAIHNDKIVGNIDFRNNGNRSRLAHKGQFGMGVLSDWRGKGVGALLVQKLTEWARQQDNPIEKIELGVLAKNEPAIALYKKMGFTEEGRLRMGIKLESGEYIDEILMGYIL